MYPSLIVASVLSGRYMNPITLTSEQWLAFLVVAVACVTGVIITFGCVAAHYAYSIYRRNAELELKREMLDRGMSAGDIQIIIESMPIPEDGCGQLFANLGRKKSKN